MKITRIYRYIIFILFLSGFGTDTSGQILFFDGAGRAVITNDRLDGNVVKNDSITPRRAISGYTLLDFGINVKPSESFKVRAEFRARNNFGQFFGAGSLVNVRQFRIEGSLRNKLLYSLGDIDVVMTPYTVYNSNEIFHQYESEIFSVRRRIAEYENFISGNNWRVQGIQAKSFLPVDSTSGLELYGFFSRTRQSTNSGIPDRFLSGASANFIKNELLKIGINYSGFFDNAPPTTTVNYRNHVFSGNYLAKLSVENLRLSLKGESGISTYNFEHVKQDTVVAYKDFFTNVRLSAEDKSKGVILTVGYINVGPQFSSPAAQTQRINPGTAPDFFPQVNNNMRGQNLFDRLSQERMYNQAISPILFTVLPQYNLVLPYGIATPNRKGLITELSKTDAKKIYELNVSAYFLSDIIGEGTSKLRKYRLIRGGGILNIHTLTGLGRKVIISGGIKSENSKRDGFAPVDFNSVLLDAGISIETIKDLDVLAGYKWLHASGSEYLMIRDQYNNAVGYNWVNMDLSQNIMALGLRYRFTDKSFVTVHGNLIRINDHLSDSNNYDIGQVFINYSMWF
ncbi:MAG: hypothetical protein ACK40G_00150 [Cytophagaceae bacterium]